jgi:hypothetical protein
MLEEASTIRYGTVTKKCNKKHTNPSCYYFLELITKIIWNKGNRSHETQDIFSTLLPD